MILDCVCGFVMTICLCNRMFLCYFDMHINAICFSSLNGVLLKILYQWRGGFLLVFLVCGVW